jgi:hypothetical protein
LACRSLDVEADRRRAEAADVGLDPQVDGQRALLVIDRLDRGGVG